MVRRPVWVNEVLGAYDGDYEPQYEFAGNKLKLLNEITTAGTLHNADNMNNLFDFDNLDSMAGNTRTTSIGTDGTVTEKISTNGVVTATRVTESASDGSVVEQVTIYDDSGKFELRSTKTTISFSDEGIIEEVK